MFDRLITHDVTAMRERTRWGRSIERLLGDAERRQGLIRAARPLVEARVVAACAPALAEIRDVLVDPDATVTPQAMHRLRTFLTDGASSPLYGEDPEAARQTSRHLAVAFVVPAVMHAPPAAA